MSNIASEYVTIGPVVLAYTDSTNTSLFTAKTSESGKESFGCTVIVGADVYQQVKALVDSVGMKSFPQEWSNPHANLKRAIHDIREKSQFGSAGTHFFSAGTGFAPQIVDSAQQPIINTVDPMTGKKPIYDGVVAYVSINAFSFSNKSRGVGIGLGPIMKYADGTPLELGGGVSVSEAFANVPSAPPPGAQAPAQNQPSGQQHAVNPITGEPIPAIGGAPGLPNL